PLVGMDGRLGSSGAVDLARGNQALTVEDTDALGREVEARPSPAALDVGELDGDLAGVLPLGGGEELVGRAGVTDRERPRGQPAGKVHGVMVAVVIVAP